MSQHSILGNLRGCGEKLPQTCESEDDHPFVSVWRSMKNQKKYKPTSHTVSFRWQHAGAVGLWLIGAHPFLVTSKQKLSKIQRLQTKKPTVPHQNRVFLLPRSCFQFFTLAGDSPKLWMRCCKKLPTCEIYCRLKNYVMYFLK